MSTENYQEMSEDQLKRLQDSLENQLEAVKVFRDKKTLEKVKIGLEFKVGHHDRYEVIAIFDHDNGKLVTYVVETDCAVYYTTESIVRFVQIFQDDFR